MPFDKKPEISAPAGTLEEVEDSKPDEIGSHTTAEK